MDSGRVLDAPPCCLEQTCGGCPPHWPPRRPAPPAAAAPLPRPPARPLRETALRALPVTTRPAPASALPLFPRTCDRFNRSPTGKLTRAAHHNRPAASPRTPSKPLPQLTSRTRNHRRPHPGDQISYGSGMVQVTNHPIAVLPVTPLPSTQPELERCWGCARAAHGAAAPRGVAMWSGIPQSRHPGCAAVDTRLDHDHLNRKWYRTTGIPEELPAHPPGWNCHL